MKIALTSETRLKLLKQHKQEKLSKSCDRIKAVLLSDDGLSCTEIGKVLFLHEDSITRHLKDYISSNKLSNASGGSESKLDDLSTKAIIAHLEEVTYQDANEIIDYIFKQYKVKYSHSGMVNWLHENNFSYKSPAKVPAKADLVLQAEFIEEYKSLKSNMSEDTVILFGDGVHPTMQTKVSHGWIATGKNKPIATTASRTRLNILGAINLDNMDLIHEEFITINSVAMANFLSKIKSVYPGKSIHLILDQGSYNKSEVTKAVAEALGIKIHYLPPYSPNLNPIERVWKIMNEITRNNVFFKNPKEFKYALLNFFSSTWDEIKESLVTRVNDNFQRLDPYFQ